LPLRKALLSRYSCILCGPILAAKGVERVRQGGSARLTGCGPVMHCDLFFCEGCRGCIFVWLRSGDDILFTLRVDIVEEVRIRCGRELGGN